MSAIRIRKYELIEKLGEGGMGVVWKARDTELDRLVVIKAIHDDYALHAELRKRFIDEARIQARLVHPNICTLFDAFEEERKLFLVMELIEGQTLKELIEAEGRGLPAAQVVEIAKGVLSGLHFAHEHGVVHRDIKPSNIMVDRHGHVKIMDFGIAKVAGGARMGKTKTGMTVGTPEYMSPEQIQGMPVDGRSDLYSLGIVLYEMLTGDLPFPATSSEFQIQKFHVEGAVPSARARNASVPEWLDAVVRTCMAKTPDERYSAANELLTCLAQNTAQLAASAKAVTPRQGMRMLVAGAALAMFLTVLAGGIFWRASIAGRRGARGKESQAAASTVAVKTAHVATVSAPVARQDAAALHVSASHAPEPRVSEERIAVQPSPARRAPKPHKTDVPSSETGGKIHETGEQSVRVIQAGKPETDDAPAQRRVEQAESKRPAGAMTVDEQHAGGQAGLARPGRDEQALERRKTAEEQSRVAVLAGSAPESKGKLEEGTAVIGQASGTSASRQHGTPAGDGDYAVLRASMPLPQKRIVQLGSSATLELVLIPAGRFIMGSPLDDTMRREDEVPQHQVHITRPFYLSVYEVTQAQWKSLMGSYQFRFSGEDAPAHNISWHDCVQFCRTLTERERNAGRMARTAEFRLPTEAEWEYACRAGTATRYSCGDDKGCLDGAGWYFANAGKALHRVGQKAPNAFGLYDMHGNVWEWCADWYDARYYQNSPATDPAGAAAGIERVIRGGGWDDYATHARSAARGHIIPNYVSADVGFRVLLTTE